MRKHREVWLVSSILFLQLLVSLILVFTDTHFDAITDAWGHSTSLAPTKSDLAYPAVWFIFSASALASYATSRSTLNHVFAVTRTLPSPRFIRGAQAPEIPQSRLPSRRVEQHRHRRTHLVESRATPSSTIGTPRNCYAEYRATPVARGSAAGSRGRRRSVQSGSVAPMGTITIRNPTPPTGH